MPLIAGIVAAWTLGLIAGYHRPEAGLALAIFAFAAAMGTERRRIAAYPAVLAVAVVVAISAARAEARCRSAPGPWLDGYLRTDAIPGRMVRLERAGCGRPAALLVVSGGAAAGSRVRVHGRPDAGPADLVVREARILILAPPGPRARLRARAGRAIDRLYAQHAPLVRALLIADDRGLDPALEERFAAAGLTHILSISGMHVGIIAAALTLVLRAARVPPRAVDPIAVGIVAGYVAMIGAPPPAVRSAVMFAVLVASRLAQRPTSPWAILAIGALEPALSPRVALGLGYQLSVLGVASLIAGTRLAARLPLPSRPRWRRAIVDGLVVSTIASLASAPMVAWAFGRVSLIAPVANLAAAPIIGVLQPLLFLGLVLAPVPGIGSFVADASWPLLVALDHVAGAAAGVPYASVTIWPSTVVALCLGIAAVALLVACQSRYPGGALVAAAGGVAIALWYPAPRGSGLAEVHMLDVGQGDAIALRTPRGRWVLVDAGPAWRGGDAGRATVVPYLARRGGDLAALVLTHPHTDHVGGAAAVVTALPPRQLFDAGYVGTAAAYATALGTLRRSGGRWRRARPGDSLAIDGMWFTFLAPDSAWTAALDDPNDGSVVVRARYGAISILLVGDAERAEEEWLVARYGSDLRATVLKVGHHGSRTSSSPAFLDAVQPRVALISAGAMNPFGHPSPETMDAFAARRVRVLRTDREGTVVLETDGRSLHARTGGRRWELPLSGR